MEKTKPKRKYTKRAPRFFRNGKSIEADDKANGVSLHPIYEGVPELSTSNDETTRDSIDIQEVNKKTPIKPIEKPHQKVFFFLNNRCLIFKEKFNLIDLFCK